MSAARLSLAFVALLAAACSVDDTRFCTSPAACGRPDGDADVAPDGASAPRLVTVEVRGDGAVDALVQSIPPGISCPGQCTAAIAPDQSLRLVTTAAGEDGLDDWSHPCAGQRDCTVTPTADITIAASFRAPWSRDTGSSFRAVYAAAAALGPDDQIAVVGEAGSTADGQGDGTLFATVYNRDGALIWADDRNAGVAFDAAFDRDGALIVCGVAGDQGLLRKYGATGQRAWTRDLPEHVFGCSSIDVAPDGSIYLSAFMLGTTDNAILRYRPDGELAWSFTIPGVEALAVTGDGFLAATRHSIAAYDFDHVLRWTHDLPSRAGTLAIRAGDRQLVLASDDTPRVTFLSADGAVVRQVDFPDQLEATGVAIGDDDAVYLAARTPEMAGDDTDGLMIKLSPTGEQLWSRRSDGLPPDDTSQRCKAVVVDRAHNPTFACDGQLLAAEGSRLVVHKYFE